MSEALRQQTRFLKTQNVNFNIFFRLTWWGLGWTNVECENGMPVAALHIRSHHRSCRIRNKFVCTRRKTRRQRDWAYELWEDSTSNPERNRSFRRLIVSIERWKKNTWTFTSKCSFKSWQQELLFSHTSFSWLVLMMFTWPLATLNFKINFFPLAQLFDEVHR